MIMKTTLYSIFIDRIRVLQFASDQEYLLLSVCMCERGRESGVDRSSIISMIQGCLSLGFHPWVSHSRHLPPIFFPYHFPRTKEINGSVQMSLFECHTYNMLSGNT